MNLSLNSRDIAPTMSQAQQYGNMSKKQIIKSHIGFAGFVGIIVLGAGGIFYFKNKFTRPPKSKEKNDITSDKNALDEATETPLESVTADTPVPADDLQKSQCFDGNMFSREKSGYSVLFGPQNEGKTAFAQQLAMCRATGIPTGLMGDTSTEGIPPQRVIMFCTEKDSDEMLKSAQTNYPDIPIEAKHRIEYICRDKCRVTPQKALHHLQEAIINSQEDIFAIYDCLGSDYFTTTSEKQQAELRVMCEDLVRMANEKRIIFQIVIVCHVLGGTYKIGNKIDSGSVRLSDTFINGSRFILGIAPIGEENSCYKYLKVIRDKDRREPKDVAVIKWQDELQRFEHVTRETEYDVLSKAQEYVNHGYIEKPKRGATQRVSDGEIREALTTSKNQKEAAGKLGISESGLTQRINKMKKK